MLIAWIVRHRVPIRREVGDEREVRLRGVDDRLLVGRVPDLRDAREVRVQAGDRVLDRDAPVGFGRREAALELRVEDVDDHVVGDLVRAARVDPVDLLLVADHQIDGEARVGGGADRERADAAERRQVARHRDAGRAHARLREAERDGDAAEEREVPERVDLAGCRGDVAERRVLREQLGAR